MYYAEANSTAASGRRIPCPTAYLATINVPCLRMSYSDSSARSINLTVPVEPLLATRATVLLKSPLYASGPVVTLVCGIELVLMIGNPATLRIVPSEIEPLP